MYIIKRDGSTEPFNAKKVQRALTMAFVGTNEDPRGVVDGLVASVCTEVAKLGEPTTVEDIGDICENILMASGWGGVARGFIRYRAMRERIRVARLGLVGDHIQKYIEKSKYAWPEESWTDCCDRYLGSLERRTGHMIPESVRELLYGKMVLGSMRGLQFGGPALDDNNLRMYNCASTHLDRVSAFMEIFYVLLCGSGVGYSVRWKDIMQLPIPQPIGRQVVHWHIEDSIEGWARAANALIEGLFAGIWVELDYSMIRGEGSILHTSRALAPGHLGLREAFEKIREMFPSGRRLRPIECHQIVCLLASAVLSGGIRRASLMCMFDLEDSEMIYAKTGDWYSTHPEYQMANNSVVMSYDVQCDDYYRIMELNKQFGEPGILWGKRYLTNPCGEILMEPGSGFSFCNLSEVVVEKGMSCGDYLERCKAAAILGTLQACFTDFRIITPDIAERDRLLGVSMTGVFRNLESCDWWGRGYNMVRDTNAEWANILNIKPGVRLTCGKPSGTASLLVGCGANGFNPDYAKRYIRRVTATEIEPAGIAFRKANPKHWERGADGRVYLLFPMTGEGYGVSALDHLDVLLEGKTKWADHSISCTISYEENEYDTLVNKIYESRELISTIALAPAGLRGYKHLPKEVVSDEYWAELAAGIRSVDYTNVGVSDYGSACSADRCSQ